MGDVERGFGDVVIADAGAMHESLVRQVHQIVDHEAVVALHMNGLAVAGPGRIVVPVHVGHQRRVRQRRIAHPQPDETMAFDHGIGTHAGGRIDGVLRGHVGAAALRVEFQPVIAADDGVAVEPSLGQRHQPVPAGILQRAHLPVGLAVHHDMLAADRAGKQRVLEVDIPGGGVPGVERKGRGHGCAPILKIWVHYVYNYGPRVDINRIFGHMSAISVYKESDNFLSKRYKKTAPDGSGFRGLSLKPGLQP